MPPVTTEETASPPRPPDWVPVERRFLGMDKRTLPPAIVVLAFLALCLWGLPTISDQIESDDPIVAGDVIQMDKDIEFTPAVGWNLDTGIRQGGSELGSYPDTAGLSQRGYTFSVMVDDYDGTPAQLMNQLRKNNQDAVDDQVRFSGTASSFVTSAGDQGVLVRYSNGSEVGFVATLVFGTTGVEIKGSGSSTTTDPDSVEDMAAMLGSVQHKAEGRS